MGQDKIAKVTAVLQMTPGELLGLETDEDGYMMREPARPQMTQQEALFDASDDPTPKEMEAVLVMISTIRTMRSPD